jgi:hypothetical protein
MAAAAMQPVERGELHLDSPAAEVVAKLAQAHVLEGFEVSGTPQLRAPKRAMPLKHLLTHTAGFSQDIFCADIAKYQAATSTPDYTTCENAVLTTPLLCDPGERWEWHRSRLGWQDRRGGEWPKTGQPSPAQPLRAARDAQHLLQDISLAAGAAGGPTCAWTG